MCDYVVQSLGKLPIRRHHFKQGVKNKLSQPESEFGMPYGNIFTDKWIVTNFDNVQRSPNMGCMCDVR